MKIRGKDIIEMILDDHGIEKAKMASILDINLQHMYKILRGDADITKDMAAKIEKEFGFKASILMGIESNIWQRK